MHGKVAASPAGALFHFMQPMSDRSREPIMELAVEIERIRRGSFEVAGDNDSSCAEGVKAQRLISPC